MALFDKLLARVGYVKAQPEYPPWLVAGAEAQRFSIPDGAMWEAQAELYMRLSWVQIAVSYVADMMAKTPLNVKRRVGEKTEDIPNHPFEVLLDRPNPDWSRYELLFSLGAYYALTGNGYLHLNSRAEGTPPQEMYCIPSPNMRPVQAGSLVVDHYEYDPGNGQTQPIPAWQVLHYRRFHPSSLFVGLSPIEALATVATGDLKMQEWNTNFFGKDNAKVAGILAFAQTFQKDQWEGMKRQVKDEYGGTRRQLMMIQGTGTGAVNWIATAISQRDMEFLAGRRTNREEIFAIYAPGLASMLDVNATEANAKAGERLFRDHCWSQMQALAQAITNKVLPAYGPDLMCEFDDIRITDRQLELAEQSAYAQSHTIDEIRATYYEEEPLGDPRGKFFPAEIGPGSLALMGGGQRNPEQTERREIAPPAQQIAEEVETEGTESETVEQKRLAEIATWRRYAVKRKGPQAAAFNTECLPADLAMVIRNRLQLAQTPEEVKAAFSGPFLIKAARVDRKGKSDPDADAKDNAEEELIAILEGALNGQGEEIRGLLGNPPSLANLPSGFWETQNGKLLGAIRPKLEEAVMAASLRMIEGGVGVSWDLVAEHAAQWAAQYGYELVKGINATTARNVGLAVERYIREKGTTIGDLYGTLEPWFGAVRADMIAVTEITRAFAQGELLTVAEAKQVGMNLRPIWRTNNDELVCGVCGPRDGRETTEVPPAHPRCRCWLTHEWVVPGA